MSEPIPSRLPRTARDWLAGSALSAIAHAYVRLLIEGGYACGTVNSYLACVAHFAHWSASRRLALEDIHEAAVASFLYQHLPVCRCAPRCRRARNEIRAALSHLLALLRTEGLIAQKTLTIPQAIAAELAALDDYLVEVRGLQAITRQTHFKHVRAFLLHRFGEGNVRVDALQPPDIVRFTMEYTAGWKPSSVKQLGIALRSYLRFKGALGTDTSVLIAALPHVAQWRLARLPQDLSADEVEQLLGAFNRGTATGLRDYAIACCYVDLGLRTSEIARLRLNDLDWREGTLRIRGKGQRTDLLPLPATTGRAMVEYLHRGRRQTPSRALFLRQRPPLDRPATPDTIRAAIRNAARRCGLASRLTGTHILRHTVARRLVQSGASLKAIADLLRHRSLDTTTIYAKVDLDALASVASPWPGRRA
ncbi:MAG: tyrosine-type recombinase/integrase [Gammaproteobacteria bacterium]|nr:tyrosine-type recombinase/integrase [Gammaproteobacteria bacterium]NIR82646.1 tyrosine-type recombinase/integrase [Gammaproteobacteria bacterium]NIR92038.1 tyrosine-type recombinase/integrase [Gammaproteobacteria bacterium]NIU03798.1 tyrosine-type recombinase/integrase [Gammaproteobacteria bacterium]NIV51135.1 tyrosine-type recombinase/integrase [Gammaproteobacteria bacterium]